MSDDRFRIDTALYRAIPRGGYTKLAEHRRVSIQAISQYYDPHNTERQSKLSKGLLDLKDIAGACPEWARNVVGVVNAFAAEWCGEPDTLPEVSHGAENIITLAAKVLSPETRSADRFSLVLKLENEVAKLKAGLMFEDSDGSAGDEDEEEDRPNVRPVMVAR